MSVSIGDVVKGKVTGIQSFGAFVAIEGENTQGLVHISEVSTSYVKDVNDILKVGQEVEVKVINVDTEKNKISLSIKALLPAPEKTERPERKERSNFRKDGAKKPAGEKSDRPRRSDRRNAAPSISYQDPEEAGFNSLGDKLNAALNK